MFFSYMPNHISRIRKEIAMEDDGWRTYNRGHIIVDRGTKRGLIILSLSHIIDMEIK